MSGSLALDLVADESVGRLRRQLGIRSVRSDFPALTSDIDVEPIAWPWALAVASALTAEDDWVSQDVALRIVQGCLVSEETQEHHRRAAAVLLERMGNQRSLGLAVSRGHVAADAWTESPVPLQLDVIRRRLELSIPVAGSELLAANPFQRRFWSAVENATWVSVSAPTSAGKSYIVRRWFEDQLLGRLRFTGIYIVPTRALIEEVSNDLQTQFADTDVAIHTLPWDAGLEDSARKILVLTQERLHLLHQRAESAADLIFIDEAQKFGDGARGVLLQQVLEETVRRNPGTQVVFASPLTSNPELLLDSGPSRAQVVKSESITVNQNLLWADAVRYRPKEWTLRLVVDGDPHNAGTFVLPARPQPDSQVLPLVAATLGGTAGGNVVYANGAADAEKAAQQIFDALGPDADTSDHPDIAALRDLVQRTIHSQYALARVLQRGVAFHYGNMPLLVRNEIERLFRIGAVQYLVCTSTLLEGVNLPCRNLFARNPKKGNGNPMSAADFWNLAGRAGRWGEEFQGNIVCVDAENPKRWPELPRIRTRQPVSRATTQALADLDAVTDYIAAGAPPEAARSTPMLETMYSYLATKAVSGTSLDRVPDLEPDDANALESVLTSALADVEVEDHVIARHAGISPASMQRLLEHFRDQESLDELFLVLPESRDAVNVYLSALARCDAYLAAGFGSDKRHFGLALLITNWMRGYALARLIASRIEYLRRTGRQVKVPNEIRTVMSDVEQIARFKAPKYLACYADVLAQQARERGQLTPEAIPDISMMLELGVSRGTEVSLMALGVSRTSAVALAEFIVADDLSQAQVATWVSDHDDILLSLPALIQSEITAAVERFLHRVS